METLKIKAGFIPQVKTLLGSMMDMDFPFDRAMEIARFTVEQVEKESRLIEQQRLKLCKISAKKDKDGNPMVTEDKKNFIMENQEKFNKKLQELFNVDVEFKFNIFKRDELSSLRMTPRQIMLLEGLGFIEKDPNQKVMDDKEENKEIKVNLKK